MLSFSILGSLAPYRHLFPTQAGKYMSTLSSQSFLSGEVLYGHAAVRMRL